MCTGRLGQACGRVREAAGARTGGLGVDGTGGGWGAGGGTAKAAGLAMRSIDEGTGAVCSRVCGGGGRWRPCAGVGGCMCFRKLEIMLPITPMSSNPTQTRSPMSRTPDG
jgi:hypothetical protein